MKPNPIGTSYKYLIRDKIEEVLRSWEQYKPKSTWLSRVKGAWTTAVGYLLTSTDYFIRAIEEMVPNGPDKKATVMDAVEEIYDSIVPGLLPIYLKPFNRHVKYFVVEVIVSMSIDFIVSKYHGGNWDIEDSDSEVPSTDTEVTPS